MLNSTENEVPNAQKTKILTIEDFFFLLLISQILDVVSILLINVKMATTDGILTFMSMVNLVFILVEHEKSFIVNRYLD